MKSAFILLFVALAMSAVAAVSETVPPGQLVTVTEGLVEEKLLLGAQVLVGQDGKVLAYRNLGQRTPEDASPVDDATMFCVGSVSKPLTSACILSLVDEGALALDQPVDAYLPQFAHLEIVDGSNAERAPTLRELLCHRSGIYSQKRRITQHQSDLLYVYDHTLETAVDGIAWEKLIFAPGEAYAYSGAAYCVLGRVVEVTQGKDFNDFLQQRLCAPLGLAHTSYKPARISPDIAAGGSPSDNGLVSNPTTPHLAKPFLMEHTGGSLYSTATDLAVFANMIAHEARLGDREILSRKSWEELMKEQAPGQSYGLGWGRTVKDGKVVGLSHTGSLASSRALLRIDLTTGSYAIVLYSLTSREHSTEAAKRLWDGASSVFGGLVK